MSKLTFKEFLYEYQSDRGSLDLIKQHADREIATKEKTKARDDYRQETKRTSPEQGNLVRGKKGYYTVVGTSEQGTHIRPLGTRDEESVRILGRDQYRFELINDPKFSNKTVYQGKKIA